MPSSSDSACPSCIHERRPAGLLTVSTLANIEDYEFDLNDSSRSSEPLYRRQDSRTSPQRLHDRDALVLE